MKFAFRYSFSLSHMPMSYPAPTGLSSLAISRRSSILCSRVWWLLAHPRGYQRCKCLGASCYRLVVPTGLSAASIGVGSELTLAACRANIGIVEKLNRASSVAACLSSDQRYLNANNGNRRVEHTGAVAAVGGQPASCKACINRQPLSLHGHVRIAARVSVEERQA